ncbi:DNA replication pre-initiation complex subunit Cdc45 [Schizosaccharomyces octosporus yFS286]|uniref:DNA replication pre-initiation complex subunit Cdc45 n=1 Tax=Schizosaccharomyces octosporus (strain yFS286) TaxID=483514 RepID=S9Q0F7_SCHOY|nr:DNA replication pre-initiation complex subunit Cdc45 [Schizosaccharomyces octosporus yFS286]EPX73193.1 DNA replication pre-initiation complex subunit Cdc45 [Schizosaccharomyces octosporus yFS286]
MFVRRSEYALAYSKIKEASISGGCVVHIFVALDPDALCACKLLSRLLKADFISHKIRPVSGYRDLENANETILEKNEDLKFLILLNCGNMVDLNGYLKSDEDISVYVIDSHRPYNLDNLYRENRIYIFDDGDIEEDMGKIHDAWFALESLPSSDEESDSSESENAPEDDSNDGQDEDESNNPSELPKRSRRRYSAETEQRRVIRKDIIRKKKEYHYVLAEYYDTGSWFGESITNMLYSLGSMLGREDNDMLWLAIIGLTSLEVHCRSSKKYFDRSYNLLKDEVNRLNPVPLERTNVGRPHGKTPYDQSIRLEDEFRFMLIRHWSLYNAMLHSAYVGSRLHIWSEEGRKRLHKLLAKMGLSLVECKQTYIHMDMNLKKTLKSSLQRFAPLYGLDDVIFHSFTRTYGFKCTLSASDVAYAISALLEVGGAGTFLQAKNVTKEPDMTEEQYLQKFEEEQKQEWLKNFYDAYDALDNVNALEKALKLAMDMQRSIVRTGIALLEKRAIKALRSFRIGLISEGPDIRIFQHPLALTKLSLWVSEAIREQEKELGKLKHLPLVLAVMIEEKNSYLIVGTSTSAFTSNDDEDDGHGHNRFGVAFQEVANMTSATLQMDCFEASVIECKKADLGLFLESLSLKTLQ